MCGGVFSVPVVIQSPEYPQRYPHNLITAPCLWTVLSSPGDRIVCNFTDFDTEANYDLVTLCDGRYCCPATTLAVLSGGLPSTPYSSISNSLTLQMTSDGIINSRGFSVNCSSGNSVPTVSPPVAPPTTSPIPVTLPPTLATPSTVTVPMTVSSTVTPIATDITLPSAEVTGIEILVFTSVQYHSFLCSSTKPCQHFM